MNYFDNRRSFIKKASALVGAFSINSFFNQLHAESWKEATNPSDLSSTLFSQYKIHTTSISIENIHCVRVSPHVYTKLSDMDRLVEALGKIATMAKG